VSRGAGARHAAGSALVGCSGPWQGEKWTAGGGRRDAQCCLHDMTAWPAAPRSARAMVDWRNAKGAGRHAQLVLHAGREVSTGLPS